MTKKTPRISALVLASALAAALAPAHAQDKASEADAKKMLQALVDANKAKGLKGAQDALNAYTERKDMGCLIADTGATVSAGCNKAMVGQQMPDLLDVDGKNISQMLIGPLKAGKTSWDASYKFNAPGSKAIVNRKSLCAKLDAEHFACSTFTPQ